MNRTRAAATLAETLPLRDFETVSVVTKISEVVIGHSSFGTKSLTDFVRMAQAQPAKISYASGGTCHSQRLITSLGLKLD